MLKAFDTSLIAFFVTWAIVLIVGQILLATGYGLAGFYLQFGLTDYWDGAWPPTGLPFAAADDIKRSYADSAADLLTGLTAIAAIFVAAKVQSRRNASCSTANPNGTTLDQDEKSLAYANLFILVFCLVAFAGALSGFVLIVGLFFMFGGNWIFKENLIWMFLNKNSTKEKSNSKSDAGAIGDNSKVDVNYKDKTSIWAQIFVGGLFFLIVVFLIVLSSLPFVGISLFIDKIAPQAFFELFADDPKHVSDYLSGRSSRWLPIFAISLLSLVVRWFAKNGRPEWFPWNTRVPPA